MLNDTRIRNARPAERDYKLTDFDGLYLLVRKNGSKLWRFAYRFGGKQKQIALGAYPTVTLAEARDRREAARKLLADAKDPSLERRLEKMAKAAGGDSFRDVAEEFLVKQRREGRAEATLGQEPLAAQAGLCRLRRPSDRRGHRARAAARLAKIRAAWALRERAAHAHRRRDDLPLRHRYRTRHARHRA